MKEVFQLWQSFVRRVHLFWKILKDLTHCTVLPDFLVRTQSKHLYGQLLPHHSPKLKLQYSSWLLFERIHTLPIA